jgi:serine/threonine protein phosphatase PrpC
LQIEYAELSLVGDREDNQDRVAVAVSDQTAFLAVVDGMGGHADGARAADAALKSLMDSFWQTPLPVFDPLGFVHLALGRAHDDVVALGTGLSVDARPRATTAVCLIQEGTAYWGHVGDSRIYWIRGGTVVQRTRDHSHVELLLREGKITEDEIVNHPMRNFVECCLGGDPAIPEMSIAECRPLRSGDIMLLCTDGIWANLRDNEIARFFREETPRPQNGQQNRAQSGSQDSPFKELLDHLGTHAVRASAPFSDNSTAAALRWNGA